MKYFSYLCTLFGILGIQDLQIVFAHHPQMKAIGERLTVKGDRHVLVSGLHASARALALEQVHASQFIVSDNAENAQYLYGDLRQCTKGQESRVFFFPSAQKRRAVDEAAMIQRTETLSALSQPLTAHRSPLIVITYPEAIAEPVPAKEELSAIRFQVSVGQEIQQSALSQQLSDLGFEHVDFVFQPGQYAVRGSIVDIYSYSHDNPYRLDFFGDEIDSIREFDIEDQLSKNKVDRAEIVGAKSQESGVKSYLPDYLTEDFIWVSNDWTIVRFKLDGLGVLGAIGNGYSTTLTT